MEYSFDIEHAKKYGVEEAVLIKNFCFWVKCNRSNGIHIHDGKTWTYNSVSAFGKIYSFWSNKQIYRILQSLKEKNVLITGNYNTSPYDRTLWYAFADEAAFVPPETSDTIIPNGKMVNTEQKTEDSGMVQPIPDIKPNNKPDDPILPGSTGGECVESNNFKTTPKQDPPTPQLTSNNLTFDKFWAAYPKKVSKGDALKAWGKIKVPVETLDKILTALEWQKKLPAWMKDGGQFIPYPATYLRAMGWEDEVTSVPIVGEIKHSTREDFLRVLGGGKIGE